MANRLSEINKEKGWGTYYKEEITIEELRLMMKKVTKVI